MSWWLGSEPDWLGLGEQIFAARENKDYEQLVNEVANKLSELLALVICQLPVYEGKACHRIAATLQL